MTRSSVSAHDKSPLDNMNQLNEPPDLTASSSGNSHLEQAQHVSSPQSPLGSPKSLKSNEDRDTAASPSTHEKEAQQPAPFDNDNSIDPFDTDLKESSQVSRVSSSNKDLETSDDELPTFKGRPMSTSTTHISDARTPFSPIQNNPTAASMSSLDSPAPAHRAGNYVSRRLRHSARSSAQGRSKKSASVIHMIQLMSIIGEEADHMESASQVMSQSLPEINSESQSSVGSLENAPDQGFTFPVTLSCWFLASDVVQGNLSISPDQFVFEPLNPESIKASKTWVSEQRSGQAYVKNIMGHPSTHNKLVSTFSLPKAKHIVLRGTVLSWFASDKDPYFPEGQIELSRSHCHVVAEGSAALRIEMSRDSKAIWQLTFMSPTERDNWYASLDSIIHKLSDGPGFYTTSKVVLNTKSITRIDDSSGISPSDLLVVHVDSSAWSEDLYFSHFLDFDRALQASSSALALARALSDTHAPASPTDANHKSEEDHSPTSSHGVASAFARMIWSSSSSDKSTQTAGDAVYKDFAIPHSEKLYLTSNAYLYRGIPVFGRLYVLDHYLCFRSLGLLAGMSRTRMILPLKDLLNVTEEKTFNRPYGLVLTIKSHEELFLEFSSDSARRMAITILAARLDELEHENTIQDAPLESSIMSSAPSSLASSAHHMFSSNTSDFITFKPENPLSFTCLTVGSRGDVQPYIALCQGLMEQGHSCKIATHAEYEDWVRSHGIGFVSIGGDPGELMQLMIAYDFFSLGFMRQAIAKFRTWLDDLLISSWNACKSDTDVLIESPSTIAGLHIAEKLEIPYFRAFTMPWTRTRAYPHAFAVPGRKRGGSYNYMTYTMFDHVFWQATAPQINKWRKDTLGLNPTSLEKMSIPKVPFLYNVSPVIMPPALDWPETVHVTGYWTLGRPSGSGLSNWAPSSELAHFLEAAKEHEKKVVFFGFGSIIIPDPESFFSVVYDSVQKAQVAAIVMKGWSRRRTLEEGDQCTVSDHPWIFHVDAIPHDWLFPKIDAAVHHGGSGTTGASLRAGLPTVICPFFGDQYFFAERVESLGAGTALHSFTVDTVTNAIIQATTDSRQRARAANIGAEIRAENGVASAIECIYRDLDYARSLFSKSKAKPLELEGWDLIEDEDD